MFLYRFFVLIVFSSQIIGSQQVIIIQDAVPLRYADKENSCLYSSIITDDKPLFDYELSLRENKNWPKFKTFREETLCHTAVSYRRNEMLKKIAPKVEPNAQAFDGQTASHYAVFHNNRDALQMLGKQRPNIEIGDNDGITPLALAVRLDRKAVAEDLLRRNANVHAKNKYGHQPLHHARSSTMVRRLLANGANIDAQGTYKDTPIAFAVKNSLYGVVKELIENDAQTTYVDERGNSLLHLARDRRIAQLLIGAGLGVHAENKKGDKPLHSAAKRILPGVVSVLMQSGANPKVTNKDKETPLHNVRSVEVARELLAQGACIQALDSNNNNVLHSILLEDKREHMPHWADLGEFLLNSGLSTNRYNSDRNTILSLTIDSKYCDMLKLLEERGFYMDRFHGSQRIPSLAYAAEGDFAYGVNTFLRLGMSLKVVDSKGRNAVHYAAYSNSFDCLRMLVDSYVSSDKVAVLSLPDTDLKNTPLHYAAHNLNVETVEFLLSHGASHSPVNARGITPVNCVESNSDEKAQEIKGLLDYYASLNQKPPTAPIVVEEKFDHSFFNIGEMSP